MATWLLALALALTPAPQSTDPIVDAPPPAAQILALPDGLREDFQRWEHSVPSAPADSAHNTLEHLIVYMFDAEKGLGLQYEFDANYTVGEVFQYRKVNCLSFTLTVVAMARDLGLDAYAQEIPDVLTWYQEGNTVFRNNHVNAGVRIKRQRFTMDVAWDIVIARQQPHQISDAHLFSLFYNNRAVALLNQGKTAAARVHMQRALSLDKDYAAFWNNFGVLNSRQGDMASAEHAYLQALKVNNSDSPSLFNLSALYNRTGRKAEAMVVKAKLEKVRAKDPFDQFLLALERENRGDYTAAVEFYRRAIRLYDGEYRFYEGLARVYLHLGDAKRAGIALAQARELSANAVQAQYQAKLERMRTRENERKRLIFDPFPLAR